MISPTTISCFGKLLVRTMHSSSLVLCSFLSFGLRFTWVHSYATPERTLDIVKLMLERNVPVGDGWLLTLQKKFQGSEFSKRILNLFELHCIAANRDEDDHMSETLLFFYLTFRKFDKARALFEQLCASGTQCASDAVLRTRCQLNPLMILLV